MSSTTMTQETYLPGVGTHVSKIYDFLRDHDLPAGEKTPRYFLTGVTAEDRVELPLEIFQALRQVVEALQQGLAVTVAPTNQVLTTQQAADMLGVSRPTLVRLLDEGKIPYERMGNRRRLLLRDLLIYRDQRRAEQYAALDAMAVDINDPNDLQDTIEQLREARKVIASRRRHRPST